MICPFCKEEIADGAIKCKHCASMLSAPQTAPNKQADISDAEETDYSRELRKLFEGKEYRVVFGLPIFANFRDQLKACWWAGLPAPPFNVLAYLFRGMMKKSIALAGLYALVAILFKMQLGGIAFLGILASAFYVVAAMRHDEFRKEIQKESDFWW